MCTVFVTLLQCFHVARAGNVPICPCSYSYWYPVQCFAWSARAMYLFFRVRTRTGTPCTVLRLVSTGSVPICPCLFARVRTLPVFVLVLCVNRCTVCTVLVAFPWASAGNVPICPCSYSHWYPFVPLVHASTANAPTYPRLCSYCTCTVAQYVLYCTSCNEWASPCSYSYCSCTIAQCTVLVPLLQWSSVATAGNVLFTRFCTRAVLVLLHSPHG